MYTLYNKKNDRRLTHPVVGIWYTSELKEAEEMLDACHQTLENEGMTELKSNFVIIEADSGEEVTA